MKILATLSLSIACLFFLTSCNNDDLNLSNSNEVEGETFRFIYKGNSYSSTYHFDEDSTITLHDIEIDKLYQELRNSHELVVYIRNEEIPEFFENTKEFEDSKIIRNQLRARPFQPYFTKFNLLLYNGPKYSLDMLSIDIDTRDEPGGSYSYEDLRQYDFDKKISSFKASATYGRPGDKIYTGYTITFYLNYFLTGSYVIFERDATANGTFALNMDILGYLGIDNRISSFKINMY